VDRGKGYNQEPELRSGNPLFHFTAFLGGNKAGRGKGEKKAFRQTIGERIDEEPRDLRLTINHIGF
jgi:hypothetical protein